MERLCQLVKSKSVALLLPTLVSACSSTGAASPETVAWPPGRYRLEAVIEYRQDSRGGEYTARETYSADLTVGRYGAMDLRSPYGICQDPPASQVRRDVARGRRSFECGDARYFLLPGAGIVRGEIVVAVREQQRTRASCARYVAGASGERVCEEYRWQVVTRMTDKRARLDVTRL